MLRLLELEPDIQEAVRGGALSMGHARALLAIIDPRLRMVVARKAIRGSWSVRMLERAAAQEKQGGDPAPESASGPAPGTIAHLRDLERRLGEHLGTRVAIRMGPGRGAGKLIIDFYDPRQFEGLLRRLGLDASA